VNRDEIKDILKNNMPAADDEKLGRLSEKVEQELETYGRLLIRKMILQDREQTMSAGFKLDTRV